MPRLTFVFALAVLLNAGIAPSLASAGFTIGTGDVQGFTHDSAYDIIAVDLNNPATFGPGQFIASTFNYQFNTTVIGNPSAGISGSITPILLTGGGTNFTPIAIGNTINYTGPTAFLSVTFGGSSAFTLSAITTVYAGVYWTDVGSGPDERMPIGFDNNIGNVFVVYGGGTGPGANTPAIGTQINGTGQGFFNRKYDFSISVEEANPVPGPSSLLSAITGAVALFGLCWLRTKRIRPTYAP